jgi:hypothetical protein
MKANLGNLKGIIEKEMGPACRFDLGQPQWATWNRVAIDAFVKRNFPKMFPQYREFFYKPS